MLTSFISFTEFGILFILRFSCAEKILILKKKLGIETILKILIYMKPEAGFPTAGRNNNRIPTNKY